MSAAVTCENLWKSYHLRRPLGVDAPLLASSTATDRRLWCAWRDDLTVGLNAARSGFCATQTRFPMWITPALTNFARSGFPATRARLGGNRCAASAGSIRSTSPMVAAWAILACTVWLAHLPLSGCVLAHVGLL